MTYIPQNYPFKDLILPKGYFDKLDDSLLGFYCLTRGTRDVIINDEGKISKRLGYTLFSEDGTSKTGITSSYTWETSSNRSLTLRSFYDKLQVYYNGKYRDILTGIKDKNKFRFVTWWDKNEVKDKLIMVNGSTNLLSWSGGITEIASWTSTTITKKYAKQSSATNNFVFSATNNSITQTDTDFITLGFKIGDVISIKGTTNNNFIGKIKTLTSSVITLTSDTSITDETISNDSAIIGVSGKESWRAERFTQNSGDFIFIGDTSFTYTAGWDTPTLTLTGDPSSKCNVGDVVYQPIKYSAPISTNGDLPANMPIDVIGVNLNQIYIGSQLFRGLFISRQDNFQQFSYSTTLRKVGEGGTVYLDSNLVGIAVSKGIVTVSCGKSDVYEISLEAFSDGTTTGSGELIRVKKLQTAYGQGAISQESFIQVKNGIIYLTNEPTIDFLGNIENIEGVQSVPLSDSIKRLVNRLDNTGASGVYYKNSVFFLYPNENILLMYDLERKFWQPPQTLSGSSLTVFENKLLMHSNITDETYVLFDGFNDNGNKIYSEVYLNIETNGSRSVRKILDEIFIEVLVNSNTNIVDGKVIYGYLGAGGNQPFQVGFNEENENCIESPQITKSLGMSNFGSQPFGSVIINNVIDLSKYRLIRKYIGGLQNETFTTQLYFTNDDLDSYFEIISVGLNTRYSTTINSDMKE